MDLDLAALTDPALIQARAAAFLALKPACTRLLPARADAQQMRAALAELAGVVGRVDPVGLRCCWDFTMFPLLIMAEAAADLRRGGAGDADGARGKAAAMPAFRSDAATEALLACILAVQLRCGCSSEDQALAVLKAAAPLISLPREAAPEELRLLAFRCVAAAVQQPAPAAGAGAEGSAAGGTADAFDLEAFAASLVAQQLRPSQQLLAGEGMAPLAGAMIHACLVAAEQEVAAAGLGSKGVRTAALAALRALMGAAATPQSLTPFLPGIVSGLAKQLLASGGWLVRCACAGVAVKEAGGGGGTSHC